jgi:hypothetical protein
MSAGDLRRSSCKHVKDDLDPLQRPGPGSSRPIHPCAHPPVITPTSSMPSNPSKPGSIRPVAPDGVILSHPLYEPTLVAPARTLPHRRRDRNARVRRLRGSA